MQVIETARAAFDPYVHGVEVRFTAPTIGCIRARDTYTAQR